MKIDEEKIITNIIENFLEDQFNCNDRFVAKNLLKLLRNDLNEFLLDAQYNGHQNVYNEGYADGVFDGKAEGFDEGFTQGENSGIDEGFDRGYEQALKDNSI